MKVPRQDAILELLGDTDSKSMTTVELAEKLQVAPMTIRRDLTEMSKKRLLSRTYGGASLIIERTTNEKAKIQREAKLEIGRQIALLVAPKSTVYLGAGTTINAAVPFLPTNPQVLYVTNSDLDFRDLLKRKAKVILAGGTYEEKSNQFLGAIAEQALENFYFDLAFIGTNGVYNGQATTSNLPDKAIKEIAIKRAMEKYVVADATKIGVANPYPFANIGELTGIIVDSKLAKHSVRDLRKLCSVIVAKPLEPQK